jgi:hypothetical protein
MKLGKGKLAIVAVLLTLLAASTIAFALWSMTKPIDNSIVIVGTYGFELFTDEACTQPFSGTLEYGEITRYDVWKNGPRLWGKNTGDDLISVTWNVTTFPTGVIQEIYDPYNGNPEWIQNEQQTWASGYKQCMQLDLVLSLAGHALGTFTWTTTFYAKQA